MESVHVPSVIKLVSVRPGPGPGPGLVAAVSFPPLYFWNCLCILDIFNKMHRYHFKIETTLTDPPSSAQKHKIYENTKKLMSHPNNSAPVWLMLPAENTKKT